MTPLKLVEFISSKRRWIWGKSDYFPCSLLGARTRYWTNQSTVYLQTIFLLFLKKCSPANFLHPSNRSSIPVWCFSLQDLLAILYMKGPSTEGIFRKAANEKARKELKEDLNKGGNVDLKSKSVHLLAVVLKVILSYTGGRTLLICTGPIQCSKLT